MSKTSKMSKSSKMSKKSKKSKTSKMSKTSKISCLNHLKRYRELDESDFWLLENFFDNICCEDVGTNWISFDFLFLISASDFEFFHLKRQVRHFRKVR
jgi:hypothetical protein